LSHLLVAASSDTNGNPKVKAFLEDLIDDHNMSRNPLLACDALLRQCDPSFSNGATGYSPESSSIKWDHLKSRPEGIDCMQLAEMVTRAYLQKQGDLTGVTMSNVNNLPAARQEIAERYDICLLNDSNKAREEENSMKFKKYVAFANVLVAHGQPSYLASILHIAKFSLHPYEMSRASPYKSAVAENVEAKAVRTVNHIQTSAKGPSSLSNSEESELYAQVASLQTQFNSMQKAIPKASASAPTYNRSPPPTPYTASSPYPSLLSAEALFRKAAATAPLHRTELVFRQTWVLPPGMRACGAALAPRLVVSLVWLFIQLVPPPLRSVGHATSPRRNRALMTSHRCPVASLGPMRMGALIARSALLRRHARHAGGRRMEVRYGGRCAQSNCVPIFHPLPLRSGRRQVQRRRPPQEDYSFPGWHQAHRLGNRSDSPTPRHTAGRGGCFCRPIFYLRNTDSIRCFSSHRCA
jgi:hypothetical protein